VAGELKGIDEITRQIEVLKHAATEIRGCREVGKVKRVADWAQMIKLAARRVGASIEVQNEATEAALKARHWEGTLLRDMPKPRNQHDCPSRDGRGDGAGSDDGPALAPLRELGITYNESSRAQCIARIPEDRMAEAIDDIKSRGEELAIDDFLKWGRRLRAMDEGAELAGQLESPEEKARRGFKRWSGWVHDVAAYFGRLRDVGGIGAVIRGWDAAKRREYRELLRETGDKFHGVAGQIEAIEAGGEGWAAAVASADDAPAGDRGIPEAWGDVIADFERTVDALRRRVRGGRMVATWDDEERRRASGFLGYAIASLEGIRDEIAEALAIEAAASPYGRASTPPADDAE
jgi:hypothetical protein